MAGPRPPETGTSTMASAGIDERRDEQRVLVVLRHGAIEERTLPPAGTLTIGRDEAVDVTIADRSVSRHHATLRIEADGVVTVADEGSRNGTTVGGRRVGREPVVVGERETLVFGDVACHLMTTRRSAFRSDLRLEAAEFDRRLVHEGERALRYEHSVSVLAIRFVPGDAEALGRALRAVSGNLTDLDLYVARDAEAVDVMLVETDRAEARVEADRLAAALVDVHAARIGVATFPGDSPSPALLAAAADLAARGAAGPGVYPATDAVRVLRFGDREVIVADRAMHRVFGLIERVAPTELSVLFTGETGTGKEVATTALHALGPRKRAPLVSLNCAALPEQLLESELFGHERGAFSGAVAAKPGLFEQAAGGTLFLDEIGEMSPPLQAKLLRVLETKRLRRVGGVDERAVDVRVVSATHRDLDREVATGGFRADLLYRLRGMQIELPPLRARPQEIPILAARFVAETLRAAGREVLPIADDAQAALRAYRWPGNVRELRHALTSAAVLAEGGAITAADLPETVRAGGGSSPGLRVAELGDDGLALDEAVRAYERDRIERAMASVGGNQTQAAKLLGIPRKTLVSKLKILGLR
ncbi:MAG: sigma 54-interacting transcriptional regulator [Myxococcales bacterium]|nr:sigma 54-interacting transcriptional regulator [Myxococcales bacterium]